ncbi:MAG TPA: ankyrin repeat domain-containing protein [Acidimicrobiales bacterium]
MSGIGRFGRGGRRAATGPDRALACIDRNDGAGLRRLLESGLDPNLAGADGRTPLRLAVQRGRTDLVRVLRRYGARYDATEVDRFLGACARNDRTEAEALAKRYPHMAARFAGSEQWALVDAAAYVGTEAVDLMLDLGFGMDARRDDGATALHAAAYAGRPDLVRRLAERGADLDAPDGRQQATPVEWAVAGSDDRPDFNPGADWLAAIKALVDAGAAIGRVRIVPRRADIARYLRTHGFAMG